MNDLAYQGLTRQQLLNVLQMSIDRLQQLEEMGHPPPSIIETEFELIDKKIAALKGRYNQLKP